MRKTITATVARERLNEQAQAIEEAQTDIRVIIKEAYLYHKPTALVNRELEKVITAVVKGITIPRLKKDTAISLLNFANKQRLLWQKSNISPALLLLYKTPPPREKRDITANTPLERITTEAKGVAGNIYYDNLWKKNIKPVLERLVNDNALDPNDYTGRNSLRNLAEMEVRYNRHKDEISALKSRGVKIMACSAHEDCSDRCAPYQGRLYSLDGTSGVIDGIKYVPLEEATQNPRDRYVTKAGRVYQNGLFGFNCRHYGTEYTGQLLPVVSKKERKREYAITQQQRVLERAVRKAKALALMVKGINDREYKKERARARAIFNEYVDFCKKNNRAFYKIRTNI